ncbi:iron-sulfur cluster assembly scaffold protein [Candidatus Berkelbacteria bacterium]|nr:iron-sulfur cluster assembly scaffold protein [Candidatus Berkelbacteria bacterium]
MTDLYRPILVDHARQPRHSRRVDRPTHQAEVVNPTCGDRAICTLVLNGAIVSDVGISVEGCAIATAAGSVLAESILGLSLDELSSIDTSVLCHRLGAIDLPASRVDCLELPLRAVRQALAGQRLLDRFSSA